ncbi:MAG: GGDEF domain-containing protein [Oscillospiraceae bacterium]|jgi:diguanylate cyclase (GGDEF)-like protein|nr:GGDEF domain-containing protein [Oscillospiraceae bacterium]
MNKPSGSRNGFITKNGTDKPGHGQAYLNYQVAVCRPYINKACLALGVFNEAMLVPDLLFVESGVGKLLIALLRTAFTAILIFFSVYYSKSRGFRSFHRAVTSIELFSLAIFLFVMVQYDPPDFIIQSSGLYLLILIIFLFPNRYRNMLLASVIGVAGFLVVSRQKVVGLECSQLAASIVYSAAMIFICSVFTLGRDRQQYREFLAKTRLIEMNYTDQLTKASNRSKLLAEFKRWAKICRQHRQPISLSLFDIDHFKAINDQYGHLSADNVLIELTELIRTQLRNSDLLVRWGGDEFVILLPRTELKDAVQILERIRSAVKKKRFIGEIRVTCSFGVEQIHENSTLDATIKAADTLMYAGKKQGGNRVEYRRKVD